MGEEVRTLPSPLGLSDFELGVTLGTGSFGRVRFVTHKVRTAGCVDVCAKLLCLTVHRNAITANRRNIRARHFSNIFPHSTSLHTHTTQVYGFILGSENAQESRGYSPAAGGTYDF